MTKDVVDNLPGDLFRVLFEKSPGSLLVKADAPKFTILAASDGYLTTTSVQRDQIIGKGFFEVFPDDNDPADDETSARRVFTKVIETREKVDVPVYRYDVFEREYNEKQPHYWSCSNVPIMGGDNEVAFILNTVVDITVEVKSKEAAIESENRLLLAAEATGMAIWDLNLQTNHFTSSQQINAIFGHHPDASFTLADIRSQVNEDDMQNIVLKAYYEALANRHYFYEVRITWPDGSPHWIRTKGVVMRDKNEQPERMLGTIVDITESKRDDIRKNDFIAMASHELKTPLTSLKAYLQLLEAKLEDSADPFVSTALTKSGNQVNKMTALVHSFLDISKLEPGKLKLSLKPFDINTLIEESIAESRTLTSSHIIQFEALDLPDVNADRQKISQVIGNLLSNAIKYSPKGSLITLNSRVEDNSITVSVQDEGIGIKPKDRDKVFQRFYRADDEDLRNVSGFGIGLYLSSEIIQHHKGRIWVSSEEGKGSTFYFSLPLSNDAPL